jgi:hypothetical protein|tara:strand:- start:403 stop:870 length:468 start_codon:yes stop_codon:yes gene_type:complete
MAVPTSGVLTLEKIAQEALYGTYGSGTITPPIYLYDLVNGGNSAGSGNSYPTVNDGCTPNPVERTYYQITLTLAESGNEQEITVFTTRNPITGLVTNDVLYVFVSGSYTAWTGASQTYSYWIFNQGTFFGCTSANCPSISVSSSGVVTTNGCQCP